MSIVDITTLKAKFETGDVPTQQDFIDLIDTLANMTVNRYTETITTVKSTFPISYSIINDIPQVDVWLNGVKLMPSEFTATSGTSIVLTEQVDGTSGDYFIEIVGYVR